MLYYLSTFSDLDYFSFLRLFRYISFRAGGAAITAFFLTLILGPATVRLLKKLQATAPGHMEGLLPQEQQDSNKLKIPTMGGMLILFSILVSIMFWAIIQQPLVKVFMGLLIALGMVGFYDDWQKIKSKSNIGISARGKLIFQFLIAILAVGSLYFIPETKENFTKLMVPLIKNPLVEDLPIIVALILGCLVVVGSSNAVNLSDGMDGLAIGCSIICAMVYACFAYFCGHKYFAIYLQIPYIPGSSEVVVIAAAMVGSGLGFLWHNCYPAAMFMGDTGSLSIGGAIGLIAVLVKQELLLLLIGGVFVIEAGSVILQVSYFKLTRRLTGTPKRLFQCAPIHHHFQKLGWKETQVVIRFWIIALLLAALGMATLKIR